jgi:hypothetical protein
MCLETSQGQQRPVHEGGLQCFLNVSFMSSSQGWSSTVECLPSMQDAPGLILSTAKEQSYP